MALELQYIATTESSWARGDPCPLYQGHGYIREETKSYGCLVETLYGCKNLQPAVDWDLTLGNRLLPTAPPLPM